MKYSSSVIRQRVNLKTGVTIKPRLPKNEHFLPSDTYTYVRVSGCKKWSLLSKVGVLCFLVMPVLSFAVSPYCRWVQEVLNISEVATQGRSDGIISICLMNFVNLFINFLTSNLKSLIFNCLTSAFCFPKNISFASRRERLFMNARLYFLILNSPGKMMTWYLRNINKFLRYRTLCTSILKCRFPTKGIELARFVFFEVLGVPQLWQCVPLTFSYHLYYLRISNVSSIIHHGSVEQVQVKECYFVFTYTFLDFCYWILTSININRILTNEKPE